jgi:hypothetical protein
MAGWGLSFQPGTEQNGNGDQTRGRYQEPVQILTTRLPKVFGARGIAPAELLQAPGGMGQFAARGNVVAQALAQLAGLPPSMGPAPAPYESPQPSAPQSASGYGDWIRHERNLPGGIRPLPPVSFEQQRPAPWVAPIPSPYPGTSPTPQPRLTIPLPHVGVGSQPPGGGAGPINPPLPPPFTSPIFPVPAPKPPDNVGILELADRLFRPGRGGAFIPLAE